MFAIYVRFFIISIYKRREDIATSQEFLTFMQDNLPVPEEAWRLGPESSSGVTNLEENYGTYSHTPYMLQALPSAKENKLLLKRPENPVFELKQSKESVQDAALRFLRHPEGAARHSGVVYCVCC